MNPSRVTLDNLSYRSEWIGCNVDYREGYRSGMLNFHMHDYYEVSLILSGSVKALLTDRVLEGTEAKIVLTGPQMPHFISCDPDVFYSRLNLLFSGDFVSTYIPESKQLLSVFGKSGNILLLSEEQKSFFYQQIINISEESDPLRKRLKILCLLSHLQELESAEKQVAVNVPPYVTGALTYISEHYAEKIVASTLAWKLGIGRTTLMTAFKAYTGSTLNDHIIRCRVKNALHLLHGGTSEQEAAERCGFGDTCGLIRGFKKCYGMTPKQYLSRQ